MHIAIDTLMLYSGFDTHGIQLDINYPDSVSSVIFPEIAPHY